MSLGLILAVVTILCTGALSQSQGDARAEWEKMIVAKGGRERLNRIENLLITYPQGRHSDVRLVKLPDCYWSWNDDRPSPIGLSAQAVNLRNNTFFLAYSDEDVRKLVATSQRLAIEWDHTYFLGESRFYKPEPLQVRDENVMGQRVRMIYARLNGRIYGFGIDPQTHLPTRILRSVPQGEFSSVHSLRLKDVIQLRNYREASGLMMPTEIRFGETQWMKVEVKINVDHDPDVFDKPPRISAGPLAWQAKH